MLVAQKPTKGAFANLNGLPAKVRAVELERIESAERHSIVLAAIPEQVEDRSSSRVRLPRSRPCLPLRRCVASTSNFRSRS